MAESSASKQTENLSKERVLLSVSNLHVELGNKPILKGIDLQVRKGEKLTILGPSGSGKSTLLRSINLLVPVADGRMSFEGRNVDPHDEREAVNHRRDVGMVFQHFNLWPHMKILRNVAMPQEQVLKTPRQQAEEMSMQMLKKVGLERFADVYPEQLSGGQKQRVAIARALAMQPKLVLFDEPTSALDPELVREVLQVIEQVANEGMTLMIVTHEMRFAQRVSDRILFMDAGQIVEDSSPDVFFRTPRTERAKAFLQDVLWEPGGV